LLTSVTDATAWLWGWDPTPGIVAVWAEGDGVVHLWRRVGPGAPIHETVRFRPWAAVSDAGPFERDARLTIRELAIHDDATALRYIVRAPDSRTLAAALTPLRDRGDEVLSIPPEEQYLVASGRTYFKDLAFDDLRRLQLDLETTGLDPERDRIFLIAVRDPDGATTTLEHPDERELIAALVEAVRVADPDVIENHNLHGFDLPFLERRARKLGVPLALGRTVSMPGSVINAPGLRRRPARRGVAAGSERQFRFTVPGRELIDTMDAVLRYDFATRELGGHGLKAVARHFDVAEVAREQIAGDRIHATYLEDPERVRRYARADVEEVAALSRLLGGASFALAQMAPRRYERLADAGPATGVIDPLLVRAYLRANAALPRHRPGDGTEHSGAALHLFAAGVATRVVKADVASLYPSLMRQYRIGPARDHLGVLLALVDGLVEHRLAAKAAAKVAPPGSAERHGHEAMSAAMKLVVNSAYGYLGAGGLTRFADVHAANEVTRRGRETLDFMCTELAVRGVTLLEADTDGVYFSVPPAWTAADERRCVTEVAALLPGRVALELEGRYAAMLSHEPKNYALLGYDGELVLRGVAFRSSRAEPFGEAFLRRALGCLLAGDVPGVRAAYLEVIAALRRRDVATRDVAARFRLAKPPAEYLAARAARRELAYEAMIASGRASWDAGERVLIYRTRAGGARVLDGDPRDYDVDHYTRTLRDHFAVRLERAFAADDFAAIFADPDQLSLFEPPLAGIRARLTVL
jgi:DNA polymerase, archaea type